MIELKTLKDLNPISGIIGINELKAEAVKWVKINKGRLGDLWDVTEWIKYFFNLTEEDLK